jgi:hypothetical protein
VSGARGAHRSYCARLLVALVLTGIGCAHFGMTRDYMFAAEGVVTDSAGAPLQDVRVTLTVGTREPVYEAITPVRERTFLTDGQASSSHTLLTIAKRHIRCASKKRDTHWRRWLACRRLTRSIRCA